MSHWRAVLICHKWDHDTQNEQKIFLKTLPQKVTNLGGKNRNKNRKFSNETQIKQIKLYLTKKIDETHP